MEAGLLQGLLEEGFQDYMVGRAGAGGRFVCFASVVVWPCFSRRPGLPVYLTIWEMGACEPLPWLSERPCDLQERSLACLRCTDPSHPASLARVTLPTRPSPL